MKRLNKLCLFMAVALVFGGLSASAIAGKKSKGAMTKSAKHAKIAKHSKKRPPRKLIQVSPPEEYVKAAGNGSASEASHFVIDALSAGDINGAIIALRDEKNTPKLLYLAHEVVQIDNFHSSKNIEKAKIHKAYQNVAIAYHNLYLFLQNNNIEQKEFLKKAHNYYSKARSSGTSMHKAECDVLDAALLASSGENDKAEKKFSKIDKTKLRGDFASLEYLATYYAAIGNAGEAVNALEEAYQINPGGLLTWLAVGDDFRKIDDTTEFRNLMVSWKAAEVGKKLTLKTSKEKGSPSEVTDNAELFRPQKAMPHYDLKKNKKAQVTAKNKSKEVSKKKEKNKNKSAGKKSAAQKKAADKKKTAAKKAKQK